MSQTELVLVLWVALLSCATSDVPGGFYQTRYDALDVDDVLNHKRLVHHYAACLLNRGPCPPQGTDLKRILPEALDNSCQRCTEKQKFIALRTIQRLRNEYPTLWREMVDFWDPSEERIRKFEQSLTKNTTDDSQNVVLFDRFSEDASQNDVAASVKPPTTGMPYPPALPPSTTTTPRPTTRSTTTTTTRTTPRSTTTRRVSSSSSGATTEPPKVVFRPLFQEPQVFDLPSIKIRLFNDFTNVIKAGTQVAGMVFQALAGGRQNQN